MSAPAILVYLEPVAGALLAAGCAVVVLGFYDLAREWWS